MSSEDGDNLESDVPDNSTCKSLVDMHLYLHFSLIPSVLIILVLSFFERRRKITTFDNKIQVLNRRFGFVIPIDFIGNFQNRWTFGFAFGAIAYQVVTLDDYLPPGIPPWAKALGYLVGAIEVGLSYYPIFACLTASNKIVGSVLGFLYTLTWFTVTIIDIATCPYEINYGGTDKVIFEWPSLLCLVFVMGRFVLLFIQNIRICMGANIDSDETCFLQRHQAEHVQRLLRKPALEQKNWFARFIYAWDPCFKFPGRMIGTTVLSLICLYIIVSFEIKIYKLFELAIHQLEGYVLMVAEPLGWEGANQTVQEFNEAVAGVWFFTTALSSAVTLFYIVHILVCYRKQMKKLWAGAKGFLPRKFQKPESSQCVAAIARYSSYQVAYILWGYLIMHLVQFVFGMIFVYIIVYPLKHGEALDLLKRLGISLLTLGIGFALSMFQSLIARIFFLQKKIAREDKQKPLALNNRKAFHNFNYFFFFYNVIIGLGACLIRLFSSLLFGSWLIARIDRSLLQRGFESRDKGYCTWIGMIYVDQYHNNPVLVSFCNILLKMRTEKKLKESPVLDGFSNLRGIRTSVKSRTRWLLYYTLLKNPRLIIHRKQKEIDDLDSRNNITQNRLIQASVLEAERIKIQDRQ